MEVITIISTAAPRSDVEIRLLKALPYAEYLQTPWWRKRRDRSLRQAGFLCQRCDSKRELQVHHLTYANVGNEQDKDLEVVCRSCHEGHHQDEGRETHLGIYIKLVYELIKGTVFDSVSDLSEAVKAQCAKLEIPYNGDRVARAIALVDGPIAFKNSLVQRALSSLSPSEKYAPIGKKEAFALCRRLGIIVPFKSIPSGPTVTQKQADRVRAVQMIAAEIIETIDRCEQAERAAKPSGAA